MVMCWCSSSRSCSTNKQTSVGKDSAENDHCDSWWSKRLKSVRQHEQAEDWVHSTCLCSSNVSSFEMRDSRREKKEIDTSSGSGQRKFHRSRAHCAQHSEDEGLSSCRRTSGHSAGNCCQPSLSLLNSALCNPHSRTAFLMSPFTCECTELRPALSHYSCSKGFTFKNCFKWRHHLTSARIHTYEMLCLPSFS